MKQSYLIAGGVVIAVSAWLLSGYWSGGIGGTQSVSPAEVSHTNELMSVRVRTQHAQDVTREVVLHGYTAPTRMVTLRAEITGQVSKIGAERGAYVKKGDIIVHLKMNDRSARLDEAKALVEQRERRYQALQTLGQEGYATTNNVKEAYAELEAARARLRRIEVEVANTILRAPFAGVLNQRPVEVGDYVSPGDVVATIVDNSFLIVTGNIPQQHIAALTVGARGKALLITGQEVEGKIRYVSAMANEATRTFKIELAIPNSDSAYAVGVSSEIYLPVETVSAHFVSPALLALNDEGVLGVKTVNNNDLVEFHPAQVVRSDAKGLWLAGLPKTVRLITVGQGFVRPGEQVSPRPEDAVSDTASETLRPHPSLPAPAMKTSTDVVAGGTS